MYGVDDDGDGGVRIITGKLNNFPPGTGRYEIWWDIPAFNTTWPSGDVGLTLAGAHARRAFRLKYTDQDTRKKLEVSHG